MIAVRRGPVRIAVLATAVGAITALAPAATGAPKPSGPACFGKKPTIVASGSNKTVHGTKKSDVIDALGKNATVVGGAGNDLICVGSAKKVDAGDGNDKLSFVGGQIIGGKGNDVLKQVKSGTFIGKGKLSGGNGNDTITLLGPGSTVDSGTGLDTLTVPPANVDATKVTPRDGLLVNGASMRLDAPTGGPSFSFTFDDDPSASVFAETVIPGEVAISQAQTLFLELASETGYFYIGRVVPALGRTLAHWSVSFGDGTSRSGSGGFPTILIHPYTAAGDHVVVATQTDSSGASTTRTMTVRAAGSPTADLANPTMVAGTATFAITATPGAGAAFTSWYVSFGDGAVTHGTGAPPATISHTYPSTSTGQSAELDVFTDHGTTERDGASVPAYNDGSTTRNATLSVSTPTQSFIPGHLFLPGEADNAPTVHTAIAYAGQSVSLFVNPHGTYQGEGMDWGDGCSVDNVPQTSGPTVRVDHCNGGFSPSSLNTHTYSGPGNRLITVTLHLNGQPDVAFQYALQILPRPVTASLSAPSSTPQGPVTLSTAGTVTTPTSQWTLYFGDGSDEIFGTGQPPATFTHTYAPDSYYPELSIDDGSGDGTYSEPSMEVTSSRAHLDEVGALTLSSLFAQDRWMPVAQGADASDGRGLAFGARFAASLGARPKSGTLTFGDGASTGLPTFPTGGLFPDSESLFFGQGAGTLVTHAYATAGDFVSTVSGTDTSGQHASGQLVVSVAGAPSVTVPSAVTITAASPAATTVPLTLHPTAATAGANAGPGAWAMTWGDGGTTIVGDDGGYGTVPGTLSHSYPNPGTGHSQKYSLIVEVVNDHGVETDQPVILTVVGA